MKPHDLSALRANDDATLVESEGWYRTLVETSREGIWVLDVNAQTIYVNQRMAELLGYSVEELLGRSMCEFLDLDQRLEVSPNFERRQGVVEQSDFRFRRKDGSDLWALVSSNAVVDRTGRITGTLRMITDITERKRAEEERARLLRDLATSRAILETLIKRAPVGFGFVDRHRRYQIVNDALAEIDGLPAAVHLGRTVPEILPNMSSDVVAAVQHILDGGEAIKNAEVHGETPAAPGQERTWSVSYYPARLGEEVIGTGLVVEEITSRKRAEKERLDLLGREQCARAEAEAANRAKDEFLAMLGHELRNPLAPILTALQLMKLRGHNSTHHEQLVIERQVRHVVRLVDDLLDVSRITRGKVELKMERVELADVVAKSIEMSSPLLEQFGHRLMLSVPRGLFVHADQVRLSQVVSNVLTNAAKYTSPGGQIGVMAVRGGNHITLCVKDTGQGIEADLLPRVFDLFAQGEQSLDRSHGGLGLGLTIVRNLVELHGGTVTAASEGKGKGSEFVIRLPASETAVAVGAVDERPVRSTRAASLRAKRVLIVDDNIDAAELLVEAVRTMGHVARSAYDGPSALEVARTFRPEVALLDIGLPVMDGYELARRLLGELGPEKVRLVALTGYGLKSDRRRSQESGFADHMVKPIDLDRVRDFIEAA